MLPRNPFDGNLYLNFLFSIPTALRPLPFGSARFGSDSRPHRPWKPRVPAPLTIASLAQDRAFRPYSGRHASRPGLRRAQCRPLSSWLLDDCLDLHSRARRCKWHECSHAKLASDQEMADPAADAHWLADADLIGRAAEAPCGGEAGPPGRQHRVDAQPLELGTNAEDPLGDRDQVPRGGARKPRVLALCVVVRLLSGDHLCVDVWLAAVDLA